MNYGTDTKTDRTDLLALALESILRWTDYGHIDAADRLDAIHSVARVALDELGPR